MTGRFPIMRPNLCCTILHVCIWAELLLTLNGDGSTNSEPTVDSWMYMYFAAGIVSFIIIVIIISVVSMRGCKGKSKKETSRENQYMAIPMVEQPLHHGRLQPSPRESLSAPPCRRPLRTKTPPLQPNELPLPRDNDPEKGSSIVYAALNHQLPARAARPLRPTEEQSEYAAIRVKE
ncbi:E3 ubiquitin-protein transferase RMND5B [Dissostichus eleginoides]|uniref:E3 ubiquitin-protein transferase RMND5B n=1 Tax=Dissostichus eleginoides TaxID=100907 RepID=A0AAD9B3F4_DISEL|nr:E3 ubiquitin-protein transferase RMND5B [Dissostichus eleginoides]